MPNDHTSQKQQQSSEEENPVVKMAARLFAELFYKQVMAEREEKARREREGQFDRLSREDLQSS